MHDGGVPDSILNLPPRIHGNRDQFIGVVGLGIAEVRRDKVLVIRPRPVVDSSALHLQRVQQLFLQEVLPQLASQDLCGGASHSEHQVVVYVLGANFGNRLVKSHVSGEWGKQASN